MSAHGTTASGGGAVQQDDERTTQSSATYKSGASFHIANRYRLADGLPIGMSGFPSNFVSCKLWRAR
jgi:hypothetical protein